MSKKFSEQYDPKYYLTEEELLENLDRNYVQRDGIHTISDSFAQNQIEEIMEIYYHPLGHMTKYPNTEEEEEWIRIK